MRVISSAHPIVCATGSKTAPMRLLPKQYRMDGTTSSFPRSGGGICPQVWIVSNIPLLILCMYEDMQDM